jgi:hypothetical protein
LGFFTALWCYRKIQKQLQQAGKLWPVTLHASNNRFCSRHEENTQHTLSWKKKKKFILDLRLQEYLWFDLQNKWVCIINKNCNKIAEFISTVAQQLWFTNLKYRSWTDHELRHFSELVTFFRCICRTYILSSSKARFHLSGYLNPHSNNLVMQKMRC